MSLRYRTTFLAAVLLFGVVCTAPATAAPFTATWDYGPFHEGDGAPDSTPFYDCYAWGAGGLLCSWLWDQGLEVSSPFHGPMYGDGPGPFYDATGDDLPLASEIGVGDSLLQIVPACRPGLHPCFDTFTPLSMVAGGYFREAPGGDVFLISSRGGMVTAADGLTNFAGPEWTDIAWMYVGLYRPDECGDPDREFECRGGEQALDLVRLTFDADPIPEPSSAVLVGAGLLALARRYRRRA